MLAGLAGTLIVNPRTHGERDMAGQIERVSGPAKKRPTKKNPALMAWIVSVLIPAVGAVGVAAFEEHGPKWFRDLDPKKRGLIYVVGSGIARYLERRAEKTRKKTRLYWRDSAVTLQAIGLYVAAKQWLRDLKAKAQPAGDGAGAGAGDGTTQGLNYDSLTPEEMEAARSLMTDELSTLRLEHEDLGDLGDLQFDIPSDVADDLDEFDVEDLGDLMGEYRFAD